MLRCLRASTPSRRCGGPISLSPPCAARNYSAAPPYRLSSIFLDDKDYPTDAWTNVPSTITSLLPRKLHLQPNHPLSITRLMIESQFPAPTYTTHNSLSPVVSVHQNFDSLGFPPNHPGRNRTDTYYVNAGTVLRTHTSAHQADLFASCASPGFLVSADVYRRDAIDRSHYPVFHQMEAARMWSRREVAGGDVATAIREELARMPQSEIVVEDASPCFHDGNPLQPSHSPVEVEAISAHLKRSLERVVAAVFGAVQQAAPTTGPVDATQDPLRMRWIESYFPFTSPSWELEVFWQGDWLELLGCGVVQQNLPTNAGIPDSLGWAFGLGLERVAMLLFGIPDIRLFWSMDERFLSQFVDGRVSRFVPFSKHPPCYKDVAFWLPAATETKSADTGSSGGEMIHENDFMELLRDVAGDLIEDAKLVDTFVHLKTGRTSCCWRINYRSLEKTLTNEEANELHEGVRNKLLEVYGVELR